MSRGGSSFVRRDFQRAFRHPVFFGKSIRAEQEGTRCLGSVGTKCVQVEVERIERNENFPPNVSKNRTLQLEAETGSTLL